MLRQFVTYLTTASFFITHAAGAATPLRDAALTKELIQKTQLTQKARSLKDLYSEMKAELPKEVQADFEMALKDHDVEIGQMTVVKTVNDKGQEELQLQSTSKNGAAILTFKNQGPLFATLTGSENGKDVKMDITHADIAKGFQAYAEKMRYPASTSGGILSYQDYTRLSSKDRADYAREIQKVLILMEKLQSQKANGKTTSQWLYNLLIEQAEAAQDGELCMAAGFFTHYKNNSCGRGDSQLVIASGKVQCNPDFFGNPPHLVATLPNGSLDKTTTQQCYNQDAFVNGNPVPVDPERYVKATASKEDFQKWVENFNNKKRQFEKNCGLVKAAYYNGKGTKKPLVNDDQKSTCEAFEAQIERLNFSCEQLEKKDKYKGIKCNGQGTDQQNGRAHIQGTPGVTDAPTKPTEEVKSPATAPAATPVPPTPTPADIKPDEACTTLKTFESVLKCGDQPTRMYTCNDTKTKILYCDCGSKGGKTSYQGYYYECTKSGDSSSSSGKGKTSSSSSSSSFKIQPWMILGGVFGLAMLFSYYQQKRSLDNYYKMMQVSPVATPVPPPYTAPVPYPSTPTTLPPVVR